MAGKNYKTIIWHDPIYELQENEVERHYHYFKLWDKGNFRTWKEFHTSLTHLSQNEWHKYDRTKKTPGPPSEDHLRQMAAHGKWKIRRQTRINDEERYNRDLKRKIYAESEISEFEQKSSIKSKILDRLEDSVDDYEVKLSQIKTGVEAYSILKEDDRKDLGIEETNGNNSEDDSNNAEPEMIPIQDNPDWEDPEKLKLRRDMFWSMIKQRGD